MIEKVIARRIKIHNPQDFFNGNEPEELSSVSNVPLNPDSTDAKDLLSGYYVVLVLERKEKVWDDAI